MGSFWFGQPQLLVNSYLVDGLLIDSGHPNIERKFLGALQTEKVGKCVISHHHEDHSGNAEALKNKMKIDVFASPKCVEILKNPPRVSPIQYMTWGQNKKANLKPLDLNQRIETEKYSFEIIETPGHAEDMIALFEPKEGWLFSADNFINRYINVFMDNENIDDQIQSIKRILKLEFDVLMCSHFPQFRNGKAHLQSKLDFLENLYDEVKSAYNKGLDLEEIIKVLGYEEKNNARILSLGKLSKRNMVKSVIKCIS